MTVYFGFSPFSLMVILPSDGDFINALTASQDWADGTVIELRFFTSTRDVMPVAVWPADISGPNATWDVPNADVVTVIATGATMARLHYVDADADDLLWGKGRVTIV